MSSAGSISAQALASGLLPSQNFLFTAIDDVEHTWFNWIASFCAISCYCFALFRALVSRRFARVGQSLATRTGMPGLALLILALRPLLC